MALTKAQVHAQYLHPAAIITVFNYNSDFLAIISVNICHEKAYIHIFEAVL